MRFIIGLVLGSALGFAAYVLLTPQRPGDEQATEGALPGATARDNHDSPAALRRAMHALQSQVQEAWAEAAAAAEEADREIRARYRRMARGIPPEEE